MNNTAQTITVTAWRDYEYLETLALEVQNTIPQSPVGAVKLALAAHDPESLQSGTFISNTCDTFISGCCSTFISNSCDTYVSGCCH